MGYTYRGRHKTEPQPTVAPEKPPAPSAPTVPVHPKVKALLDDQKARILELEADNAAMGKKLRLQVIAEDRAQEKAKKLQGELDAVRAELTASAENYDTLASVNVNLQEAAIRASKRAEEAEHEARLARAEADTPSAVKAIQELLDAEKQKTTKLTSKLAEVKGQLGRSRQRLADARQEYEDALAGESEGLVATISADGVELHRPYLEESHGAVVALLDQAQALIGGARGRGSTATHR